MNFIGKNSNLLSKIQKLIRGFYVNYIELAIYLNLIYKKFVTICKSADKFENLEIFL